MQCEFCATSLGDTFSLAATSHGRRLCISSKCYRLFCEEDVIDSTLSHALAVSLDTVAFLSYLYYANSRKLEALHPCFGGGLSTQTLISKGMSATYDTLRTRWISLTGPGNDEAIAAAVGRQFYRVMRYILLTNSLNFQIDFQDEANNFICFKISNPYVLEDEFRSQVAKVSTTHLKYHGSPIGNWFSLIAMGIKNYSNTPDMRCGAAFGSGIYLSNTYSFSKGYSDGVVGVYEVLGHVNDYKKTSQIWVVPDESKLLLRYLVVDQGGSDIKTWMDLRFAKVASFSTSKGARRLYKEYQMAARFARDTGIHVKVNEKNLFTWTVLLTGFDAQSDLGKDMQHYSIPNVQLRVQFSQDYPYHPPLIHVVSPRFLQQTAHVTSQGALCMELLTPSGWSQLMTMENILVQVKCLLVEGRGRIDVHATHPYQTKEARDSFNAVAKAHGWL